MNTKYILVDIDGTIASHENIRGHHDYDKVGLDKPIYQTISIIRNFCSQAELKYNPIFISGRHDSCFKETYYWLLEHYYNIFNDYNKYPIPDNFLYMRESKDNRKDSIVKKELLYKFMKDYNITKDNIFCVFDDRLSVIQMWVDEGLFVFNVNNGRGDF